MAKKTEVAILRKSTETKLPKYLQLKIENLVGTNQYIDKYPISQCDYKKLLFLRNPTIKLTGKFTRLSTPVLHKCTICSYEWNAVPHNLTVRKLRGKLSVTSCPKCTGKIPVTRKMYVERLKSNGSSLRLIGEYTGLQGKNKFRCTKCKHEFITNLVPIYSLNRGCPKCSGNLPITNKEHDTRIKKWNVGKVCKLKRIENVKSGVSVCEHKCLTCKRKVIANRNTLERSFYADRVCATNHAGYTNKFQYKTVTISKIEFRVQGYEGPALKYILKKFNVTPKDIESHGYKIPTISYMYSRKKRNYHPDFFIPKLNRLIEVKSIYTFLGTKEMFYKIKAKVKACLTEGFKFSLLVMRVDGTRVKLPRDWINYKYSELKEQLK